MPINPQRLSVQAVEIPLRRSGEAALLSIIPSEPNTRVLATTLTFYFTGIARFIGKP